MPYYILGTEFLPVWMTSYQAAPTGKKNKIQMGIAHKCRVTMLVL